MSNFKIASSHEKGNHLIATSPINSGVRILHELPYVWNCISVDKLQKFHLYCEDCGVVLREQLFKEMEKQVEEESGKCSKEVMRVMKELMRNSVPSDTEVPYEHDVRNQYTCSRNCGKLFCSKNCYDNAIKRGHEWLCDALQTQIKSGIELQQMDNKGHYGLASKVYASIAAKTLSDLLEDTTLDIASHSLIIANQLLSTYCYEDFCKTMQVFRTGRMDIDPEMFEDIIFPAYFTAHLETPLTITKEIFQQSGIALWNPNQLTEADQILAHKLSAAFLSSEIFSDKFYSRIIGTFTVNSLSVYVPSPLNYILSNAVAAQNSNDSTYSRAIIDHIVKILQNIYSKQQHKSNPNDYIQDEVVDTNSCETIADSTHYFLGMSASGLFPTFSKCNHSCLPNTLIEGSDRVSVTIKAANNISIGEEITNCYIHHDSINSNDGSNNIRSTSHKEEELAYENRLNLNNIQQQLNAGISKKQRYRLLRQYCFLCKCDLCNSQIINSDEDSD